MYETPIPHLRAPVVFVHGLCGFDRLYAFRRPIKEYFPGVRQLLQSAGNRMLVARVSPTDGVARRAEELCRFVRQEVPAGPVHLVGHSMGGLDARYAVSRLGLHDRVLSVTTVGTPHRGSPFADWGVRTFSRMLTPFLRMFGIPHQAFFDLTTDACRRFNEDVPDVPGVRYFAVAGRCERAWIGPEWRFPYNLVGRAEGANDGVVSVASATWGEHTDVWAGDHLNLVNWPNRRARKKGMWPDLAPDYGSLVRRLSAAGF